MTEYRSGPLPAEGIFTIQNLKMASTLTLMPCGIQIDLETGEVKVPPDLPLTEASREFWKSVRAGMGV